MKKIIKYTLFLVTLLLTSCFNDYDDHMTKDDTPIEDISDNLFIDYNNNVYYTGNLDCNNGNYSFFPNELINVVIPNNLPTSFDLSGFLPPIGNQGTQGSCSSWATTYYIKSFQERIQSGIEYNPDRIMSPSYTYNQITQGACTGTTLESNLDILKNKGAVSISEFPYFDITCINQPTTSQHNLAEPNKISGYKYLSGQNMVNEMKSLIYNQTPILISAFLTKEFGKIDSFGLAAYREHNVNSDTKGGCHAMVVVGYSDTYNAFKVVNSWGESWGSNGFVWIDYKAFTDILNPNKTFKVINQAIVVFDL